MIIQGCNKICESSPTFHMDIMHRWTCGWVDAVFGGHFIWTESRNNVSGNVLEFSRTAPVFSILLCYIYKKSGAYQNKDLTNRDRKVSQW